MINKKLFENIRWMNESPICNVFGFQPVAEEQEIGIEIEVEGQNLPGNLQYYWKITNDGSLRVLDANDQALEYIFRKPLSRADYPKALRYLADKAKGSTIHESERTSVHVHLNASKMKMLDLVTWLCLYFIFEDCLTEWCGESRVGNHFCLRATDSDDMILQLVDDLRSGHPRGRQDYRYTACNIAALWKFGSLEFRQMRGTLNPQEIETWVEVLLSIRDAAKKFRTPVDVVEQFSVLGSGGLVRTVFNDKQISEFQLHSPAADQMMMQGMRTAQDLAYCLDWRYLADNATNEQRETNYPDRVFNDEERGGNIEAGIRNVIFEAVGQVNFGDAVPAAPPRPQLGNVLQPSRRLMPVQMNWHGDLGQDQ